MFRRSLLAAAAAMAALPATAHDYAAGEITIDHPWTRAAGANGNGAGFMRLRNAGTVADRLLYLDHLEKTMTALDAPQVLAETGPERVRQFLHRTAPA